VCSVDVDLGEIESIFIYVRVLGGADQAVEHFYLSVAAAYSG
jgi:hypothetical protein